VRAGNKSVRDFEYALRVGDLIVAEGAMQKLDTDLSQADSDCVADLKRLFWEYQNIESIHGSGSLLDLSISIVARLANLGRIDQSRVEAAIRYGSSRVT
jgi:hypothetical protein